MPSIPARRGYRAGRAAAALVLAAAAAAVAGCGDVKSPTAPPPPVAGEAAFTFARVQAEVFTPSCAKAGCHVAGIAAGQLVLQAGASYGEIVGRSAIGNPSLDRVEPGDPERSYLLKKLRGDADITGDRMPQDGPPFLTQEQIDGIAGWIRAGAAAD
jgi:hypothetical protein